MSDNILLSTLTGTPTAAADDVSGVHFQKVKIDVGGDGVSAALSNANPIPISDAGNSITVDGTVALSGTSAVSAASLPLPSGASTSANQSTAITALQLIDNLVLTEDAAHVSGDAGVLAFAVRRDANTSLVSADNDNAPLQVDATGSLKVAIISGAGSGGTAIADEAAFTLATTSVTPIGGVYNSSPDTLTTGKVGALQMTAARGLHVHLVGTDGSTASLSTTTAKAATSTMANVTAATSSTTLQASNSGRLKFYLFNDSTSVLYVKYGSTASATSFTYKLEAGEQAPVEDTYTGIITGIWVAANGSARVTELTT